MSWEKLATYITEPRVNGQVMVPFFGLVKGPLLDSLVITNSEE